MDRDMSYEAGALSTSYQSQYPFAAAPDIIRSNQKDVYFQSMMVEALSSVLRAGYGARFVHKYASEIKTFSDLLYLYSTTLIGNRTLGEEYCDIVQVESNTLKLPTIFKRCGYVVSSIILPYLLGKGLPKLRLILAKWLQTASPRADDTRRDISPMNTMRLYLLNNLSTLTSPAPIYAIGLAIFYFSGAYYHISKRAWGLKYLFSKRVEPSDQRIGYEVLGILLVFQLSVQVWLHAHNTYHSDLPSVANTAAMAGSTAIMPGGVEMIIVPSHSADLLLETNTLMPTSHTHSVLQTATSFSSQPRYSLAHPEVLAWIDSRQQRKCTLCLEELKDPGATTCGHVFCWSCISDWVKEKPECPLCRQHVLAQHVLPLRD